MDAQQFLQIHALKAMTGALAATVIDLSPEALAQALAIGDRGLTRTTAVSFRQMLDGNEPVFDLTYSDGVRALRLRVTLRQERGEWLIAGLRPIRSRPSAA